MPIPPSDPPPPPTVSALGFFFFNILLGFIEGCLVRGDTDFLKFSLKIDFEKRKEKKRPKFDILKVRGLILIIQ